MSRSYKKSPVIADRNPWAKRQANKAVRKYKGFIPNGGAFKKIYCSYDICDYKFMYTLQEYLCAFAYSWVYRITGKIPKTEYPFKTRIDEWERWYRRK